MALRVLPPYEDRTCLHNKPKQLKMHKENLERKIEGFSLLDNANIET